MASIDSPYRVDDETAVDTIWANRVFGDINNRIKALEGTQASVDAAVDELKTFGLERIDEALRPAAEEIAALVNLGALLSANSASAVTIGTSQQTLTIDATDRNRFAPASYLAIVSVGTPDNVMSGTLVSYDRESGALVVDVDTVAGSGTHSDWRISVGVPPNATHSGQTDNPHLVTAAQVGAPTTAELTAAVDQAKADVIGAAGAALDTLGEAEARIQAAEATIGTNSTSISSLETTVAAKLSLAGGTMAGALILDANPSVDLGAAPKQYVDQQVATAGAMELLASATASASASISFTGLSSAFFAYMLDLDGLYGSDAQQLLLRTSTDGGSTYDSGSSDYSGSYVYATYSTGPTAVGSSGDSRLTLAHATFQSSTSRTSMRIIIYNPSATLYTRFSWAGATGQFADTITGAGQRESATDVDAIQLFYNSGTIAAGTAKLYGLKAA